MRRWYDQPPATPFARLLLDYMHTHGMHNLSDLARLLNLRDQTVRNWIVNGYHPRNLAALRDIAARTGIDLAELYAACGIALPAPAPVQSPPASFDYFADDFSQWLRNDPAYPAEMRAAFGSALDAYRAARRARGPSIPVDPEPPTQVNLPAIAAPMSAPAEAPEEPSRAPESQAEQGREHAGAIESQRDRSNRSGGRRDRTTPDTDQRGSRREARSGASR